MNSSTSKRRETNLTRYGVDNVSKLKWVQAKRLSSYENKINLVFDFKNVEYMQQQRQMLNKKERRKNCGRDGD